MGVEILETLARLAQLGQDWIVILQTVETNDYGMWELRIASRKDGSIHAYRGTLQSVIARAYAGEKGEL
jgi:phage protein U